MQRTHLADRPWRMEHQQRGWHPTDQGQPMGWGIGANEAVQAIRSPTRLLQPGFLLATKLYIPRVYSDSIRRSRLELQLEAGLQHKLILVSAPAGFGKTTLLAQWAHARQGAVAWLSLDERDNDPDRFWAYIMAAFKTLPDGVGEPFLDLAGLDEPAFVLEPVLTALVNQTTFVAEGIVLILDNYHVITAQAVHHGLAFLLEHLPPRMHLIIATRADPPFPLARLRACNQVLELRAADLRFTLDETARFLNQAMGLALTAADVTTFASRTEGWIAALRLAALSLQQYQDQSSDMLSVACPTDPASAQVSYNGAFTGSHRFIADYLVEEVLQRQPESVQTFLLQTSILDDLTAPLCDAVTGQDGSQGMLERLVQANLFIVPLDVQRRWYRYHHLFADLLRERLQQTWPDQVTQLHQRAARWYAQNGLLVKAVHHALAAGDLTQAASMAEQVGQVMLQRGDFATWGRWLEALPDYVIRTRPQLCVACAWMLLFSGRAQAAAQRLQDAQEALRVGSLQGGSSSDKNQEHPGVEDSAPTAEVMAHIMAVRAHLARATGELSPAIELSQQALAQLPAAQSPLRAMTLLNLGMVHYLQGEFGFADQILGEVQTIAQATDSACITLGVLYLRGQLSMSAGEVRRAAILYLQALELARRRDWSTAPIVGFVHVGMGLLLREQNDLAAALQHIERAVALGQDGKLIHLLVVAHTALARVRQACGDADGALQALQAAEDAERQCEGNRFWPTVHPVAAYQARLWLALGNVEAATRRVGDAELTFSYMYEVDLLTQARVYIKQGKTDEALSLLHQLLDAAAQEHRMGSVLEILVLQALAFQAQGDAEQALVALERALAMAEPEGCVRVFVDEGAPMSALLRLALRGSKVPHYVQRLLAAFPDLEETGNGESASQTFSAPVSAALVEPLTEREVEVLQLLAAGLSNREIAEELVIAVGTVRRHLHNLYGKLHVRSRTQAIVQARELALL